MRPVTMDVPIRRAARRRYSTPKMLVLLAGVCLLSVVGYEIALPPEEGTTAAVSRAGRVDPAKNAPPVVPTAEQSLRCLELIPRGYSADSTRGWPLILYLHGSGWRGDDVESLRRIGFLRKVAQDDDFPFFVIAPQCPRGRDWRGLLEELNRTLDLTAEKYRIDPDRLYCTGTSMGGYGTWAYAAAYPDKFAAIVPVCGGGVVDEMESLGHVPIWVFHGANDQIVPIARSAELVAELRRRNSDVRFTIFPLAGHDVWSETYNSPDLYAWLLRQKRAPPS
jgi:predicted peptidase